MKRCPECRRDYYDDTLLYCLDDGNQLLYGPNGQEARTELFRDSDIRDDEKVIGGIWAPPASAKKGSFWIAVLPFKYSGSSIEIKDLAEGLAEEIVTGLLRFSYLRVFARDLSTNFDSRTSDIREVGRLNDVSYVLTGSLRESGTRLRVILKLVETMTGSHLWGETYDYSLERDNVFGIQEKLVPRVVSTVADQYGALVHSMSESIRDLDADRLSPHEAMLRAFGYQERATPDEHKKVRRALERALDSAPSHSNCLAMLSVLYWHEYAYGYNAEPESLKRALSAAQRSIASAPTNHLAYGVLATVLFLQKDFGASRQAVERSLQLNPMDASTTAFLGILIAYAGDWEFGLELTNRAIELNPHHPGWYYFPAFYNAYRERDYKSAVAIGLQINMPGYFATYSTLAAVYGQLGDEKRASASLQELNNLMPNFASEARSIYSKWLDAELTEHLLEGLRKAGMKIDTN